MTMQRDLAWRHLDLIAQSSVSYQIARYALALDYSMFPDAVVHQAKRCLLDAVGCAIGAYDAPGRPICEATIKQLGGTEEATVFCSGMRSSANNAALVNSFLVRFLDYNDMGGGCHNSDALSSILAVAEREKASGKDFITSLVISYELGARFRDCLAHSAESKGWTADIRGGFNQPPALGRLMGLTEEQIANAVGLCMSHSIPLGILDANREANVMAKNIRFGWVACDAILACMLAKNGFTGPVRVIEADEGINKVVLGGGMDYERLLDFSGWSMLDVRHKYIASNTTSASCIMATIGLVKEHDLKPEDIAEVHIKTTVRESRHTTTPAKKYPKDAENADHSSFYANAMAIKDRAFGPDAIKPEKFTDPVVLDLIEKIKVSVDHTLGKYQGITEITTNDGRRLQKRVDVIHGLEDDPLTDKELEDKFSEMASNYLPESQIRKIFDACWNLDKLTDMGELMS